MCGYRRTMVRQYPWPSSDVAVNGCYILGGVREDASFHMSIVSLKFMTSIGPNVRPSARAPATAWYEDFGIHIHSRHVSANLAHAAAASCLDACFASHDPWVQRLVIYALAGGFESIEVAIFG